MKTLPFLDDFVPLILSGRKTMTCRTRAYGSPGDVLGSAAGPLRLVSVRLIPLGIVAETFWREEGADSPEHFESVWKEIHPRRGFDPTQTVVLHEFRLEPPLADGPRFDGEDYA